MVNSRSTRATVSTTADSNVVRSGSTTRHNVMAHPAPSDLAA